MIENKEDESRYTRMPFSTRIARAKVMDEYTVAL